MNLCYIRRMTTKEIIKTVTCLPPEEAEEVMTALYRAGVSPRFDIPDEELKDAILEARKTSRSPFTSEDIQGLKNRLIARGNKQSA